MLKTAKLMGYRMKASKCLTLCLCFTFVVGCYLSVLITPKRLDPLLTQFENRAVPVPAKHKILPTFLNKKRLAVLVPFRDRFEELLEFVPFMFTFLNRQNVQFNIFVIQQKDSLRFNRASLINVGFLLTKGEYDYIAMHDVDLLPLNNNLQYEYPELGPIHISSPKTHPKYHYDTFIGGILLVKKEHFELVNGMSNNYWGWGLEDDEFYVRLKDAGLAVRRPENITTGTENTFRHVHDKTYRRRDMRKCYNQKEVTRRRDRVTGLHDVSYKLWARHNITIDGLPITVFNVELFCDKNKTPWCVCPDPVKKDAKKT